MKKMNNAHTMRVTFTVATVAVAAAMISIFFYARRRKKRDSSSSSCYLHSERKPQSAFKRVLSDNSYTPFKHLSNDENASNSHPFEAEITALLKTPQPEIEFGTEIVDMEMKDSYVWVHSETQLKELVDVLSEERFFAVDTEQHSLRSFLGFTALVQISTREKDYLVDAIALHDFMGILRPVFANPSICKVCKLSVFHGADNDIVWLQRDFHIYVVNLFDTSKACEVLSKPYKSLAYLLETYCGVTTNKLLQREDWRQRPLSAEMVHYARTDAHFLLYIANCLINELKQLDSENSCSSDKFHFVLEASRRSNMICLQLFTKEIEGYPGESSALSLFSRQVSSHGCPSISNETQIIVRQLCAWRDLMARIHDESLKYVLSDQAIVALASQPSASHSEIPKTIAQADINMEMGVNSFIISPSPVVCSHLSDIYHILANKLVNDDIYSVILQKSIGQNGSCPLSIFNYALLINSNLRPNLAHKQLGPKHPKQFSRKASRDLFVQKFSCKSPVYHNCRIFANDGRLLCYCDEKKLKCHRSHDIVLLCVDCHEVAHAAAEKYKRKIAVEFGIPLYLQRVVHPSQKTEKQIEENGVSPLQLRTAAMALLSHGPRMPLSRREELTEVCLYLCCYFGFFDTAIDYCSCPPDEILFNSLN
ncbi:hypothetical protein ACSQ67_022865 [Phaseolus vulgaris]